MRPDEHKKRKNTQYKKKHGISTKDDKQETDGKKLSKDKTSNEKSQGKNEKTDKEIKDKVKEEKTDTKEPEYDDFRRRKLVSNWSRYDDSSDDDNDEDIPTQRGEDFNKLLKEAGGSAAQFRLKDEEDWTEDQHSNGESVLALDLENLAESLSCIPLHERLGIDERLLSDEQVHEIKAVASENEEKYYLRYPKISDEDMIKKLPSIDTQSKTANDGRTQTSVFGPNLQRGNKDIDTSMKKSSDVKVVKSDYVEVSNSDVNTINKTETKARSNKNKEIVSLEDDLDMLLSLDEPDVQSRNSTGDVVRSSKSVVGADDRKVPDKPKIGGNVPDTAALEDWLDSVLDG